jgi:hypothetical protein
MHYLQQPQSLVLPTFPSPLPTPTQDIDISHFLTLFEISFQVHPSIFNQIFFRLITQKNIAMMNNHYVKVLEQKNLCKKLIQRGKNQIK